MEVQFVLQELRIGYGIYRSCGIDCCVSEMTLDKLRKNVRKMGESDILQPNINNVTHFKAFSQ